MQALERRLVACRDKADALSAHGQYLTGLIVGFLPALVFALATVLYNVTHYSTGWGFLAFAALWLYVPIAPSGLLCLVAPAFRALGAGIVTAILAVSVVTVLVLKPAW